jgi:hypothetical protein
MAIYKNYMNILGWEPETFLPMGMAHNNNRFRHQIATKTATTAQIRVGTQGDGGDIFF